jgi:hypothetical protein
MDSDFEESTISIDDLEEIPQWQTLSYNEDYEIWAEFPYPIRKKGTDRIVQEHTDKDGYFKLYIHGKDEFKHKLIAHQFLGPRPIGFQIDHKNRIKTDNRIQNLRYVSPKLNTHNHSKHNGVIYEYFDELPPNSKRVITFKNCIIHNLYICDDDFYDGSSETQYRKMIKNKKNQVHYCDEEIDTHISPHSKHIKTENL